MSKATIAAQNLVIRNETQDYANTNGRVADVLDDLNNSKPDQTLVEDLIEEALEGIDLSVKMDKPNWTGSIQFYIVKSDTGSNNLQEISLSSNRVPYWTGSTLSDSPIYIGSGRVGIGAVSSSEALEISGNVKANALILPNNATSAVANRLRSDGSNLYFSNGSSIEKRIAYQDSLTRYFVYTATGNFTMSQLKSAVESAGLIFNGITIFINVGSNNYTCNIDIGATNIYLEGFIQRIGTGSISFTSSRTLDSGVNNITILSGNQSSFCYFQFLDKDYIKIKLY